MQGKTMTFKERLKGVRIGLITAFIGIPIAVIVTISTSWFWAWFENTFEIESFGHSGPAEWCYMFSYVFVIGILGLLWSIVKRRTPKNS